MNETIPKQTCSSQEDSTASVQSFSCIKVHTFD